MTLQGSGPLSVQEAIANRRSIRHFTATPVPDEVLRAILTGAARAASGVNAQPWLVHIVRGQARRRISQAVRAVATAGNVHREYDYLPEVMEEPYLSRRRKLGFDLYARYGIERSDIAARQAAMLRNFDFFGAPVGLFLSMDRKMTQGSWLDCGMFLQNIMLLARSHGLETCAQQAWCDHGDIVHSELDIPSEHILLTGMAIGHADWSAPENGLISERASLDEFTTWCE